jgi:hypothetical protein
MNRTIHPYREQRWSRSHSRRTRASKPELPSDHYPLDTLIRLALFLFEPMKYSLIALLLLVSCAATNSLDPTFLTSRQLYDDAYLTSRANNYAFYGPFYDGNDSAFRAVKADSVTMQAFVFGLDKYRSADSLNLLPPSEYVHIQKTIDVDFQIMEAHK